MTSFLRFLLLTALVALLARDVQAVETQKPNAQEILRKLIERSEDPEILQRRNNISYQRASRVEYLNDDGTVRRETLRIYKIAPENGKPVTRLVSVNGRRARENTEKNRSAARETGEKGRTLALSEDLLCRFDFTLLREEDFASRPAWVLSFTPKSNAPTDGFLDKLINAMSGTFWVDQEDYQLAKADLRLNKRVAFFGGIAGAIEKIDLTLIQRRIEDSVWLGEAIHIDFTGRKLLSNVRFRAFENCADFQAVPGQHASAK